jgi:hypothetical protein
MALPDTYRAFVLDQQRQLARLVRQNGIAPIKKLYEDMLAEVTRKLGVSAAGSFSDVQLRGMLAQIKLGLATIQHPAAGALNEAAFQTALAGARASLEAVARLERQFTGALVPLPLLETARLNGLVKGQTSSLLTAHEISIARYGTRMVGRMEQALGASIAAGETTTQAIDRITATGEMEWWQGERIVRTELAYSTSASTREAIEAQSEELDGDLWMRWTEHVSDDGQALDDRVGVDSEAMHGQVTPPGGMFTQPPAAPDGEDVAAGLAGQSWSHPPNRPNDRSVLMPWRAHWGVPGWIWLEGRRTPATEKLVEEMTGQRQRRRAG